MDWPWNGDFSRPLTFPKIVDRYLLLMLGQTVLMQPICLYKFYTFEIALKIWVSLYPVIFQMLLKLNLSLSILCIFSGLLDYCDGLTKLPTKKNYPSSPS